MKKPVILFAFIGLLLTWTNPAIAQWSADVYYDTTGCDCGTITSRTIDWELWDTVLDQQVEKGTDIPLGGNNPYTIPGTATIIYDQQLRYRLFAWVKFKVGSTTCCEGWAIDYFDSDQLEEGTAELDILME